MCAFPSEVRRGAAFVDLRYIFTSLFLSILAHPIARLCVCVCEGRELCGPAGYRPPLGGVALVGRRMGKGLIAVVHAVNPSAVYCIQRSGAASCGRAGARTARHG